jgi:hypothetical protein
MLIFSLLDTRAVDCRRPEAASVGVSTTAVQGNTSERLIYLEDSLESFAIPYASGPILFRAGQFVFCARYYFDLLAVCEYLCTLCILQTACWFGPNLSYSFPGPSPRTAVICRPTSPPQRPTRDRAL